MYTSIAIICCQKKRELTAGIQVTACVWSTGQLNFGLSCPRWLYSHKSNILVIFHIYLLREPRLLRSSTFYILDTTHLNNSQTSVVFLFSSYSLRLKYRATELWAVLSSPTLQSQIKNLVIFIFQIYLLRESRLLRSSTFYILDTTHLNNSQTSVVFLFNGNTSQTAEVWRFQTMGRYNAPNLFFWTLKQKAEEMMKLNSLCSNCILKYNCLLLSFLLALHVLYYMENLNHLLFFTRYYVTVSIYHARECERSIQPCTAEIVNQLRCNTESPNTAIVVGEEGVCFVST
jgi:hypothetical protein